MSARHWKPGDLAKIVVGGSERLAFRRSLYWWDDIGSEWDDHEFTIANARPLVVIDPEDRGHVERLVRCFLTNHPAWGNWENVQQDTRDRTSDAMQAALRSLTAGPKPKEPTGLGAVVEDVKGERWIKIDVHADCNDWAALGAPTRTDDFETCRYTYAEIAAVKVLSEGVTP